MFLTLIPTPYLNPKMFVTIMLGHKRAAVNLSQQDRFCQFGQPFEIVEASPIKKINTIAFS